MSDDVGNKVVFFVSPPDDKKQTVDLVLMITEEGWEYIKTARTATLDLNKVGVPLRDHNFWMSTQGRSHEAIGTFHEGKRKL